MRRDLCVNSNLHMDKERMVSKMMNSLIELKECGLPMDDSLRGLRLKKYPLQFDENILIFDRLEPDGILLLYEYTGGGLYLPMTLHELEDCENAILVAGVAVSVFASEKLVYVNRYFSQLGYEEYISILLGYIDVFAKFYGCSSSILDLRKGINNKDIRHCRCLDFKYW